MKGIFSISGINALPRFGSESANLSNVTNIRSSSKKVALYLHIPYCKSICQFCMLRRGARTVMHIPETFIEALLKDIEIKHLWVKDSVISSIYVGGGTPSMLSPSQLDRLLIRLKASFNLGKSAEVTFEGEAQSLNSKELLDSLALNNIQRVSFGIQTFNQSLRQLLGRTDSISDIDALFSSLKQYSFKEINVDYMYNLPGTSIKDIACDLEILKSYAPTSIDCHPLKYISSSHFMLNQIVSDKLSIPDSEQRKEMFLFIKKTLNNLQYVDQYADQYSLYGREETNFYMRHIYGLDGGEYLGIGPGARSHIADWGFSNVQSIDSFSKLLQNDESPIEKVVFASLIDNYITLFPKRNDELYFTDISKSENSNYYFEMFKKFIRDGFVEQYSDYFVLTDQGLNWYQNLQEFLLSPSQRAKHKQTAILRNQKFESFGGYFKNTGKILEDYE